MNDFEETLENYLETLSCAQVSIDQTTSFILAHGDELEAALKLWSKFVARRNEEKSAGLLYLANDLVQKLPSREDRTKVASTVGRNYKYLRPPKIHSVLVRVIKIWSERKLVPSETLRKLLKLAEENISDKKSQYTADQICAFLKLFNERKIFIDKITLESTDVRISFNKEQDRMKVSLQINELKEELEHCKIQKVSLSELTNYFTILLESARNALKNYRNYRDQMIQLRWKVENIKQKIITVKKDQHEKMTKESYEVKDMEIESLSLDSESLAGDSQSEIERLIENSKLETAELEKKNKSPEFPIAKKNEINFEMTSIVDGSQESYEEPLPEPTVYDYNHGINPITTVVMNMETQVPAVPVFTNPYNFIQQFPFVPIPPPPFPQSYDPLFQMQVADPFRKFREL